MRRHDATSPYYPILLNIQGKKCLVVGGGEVALRKAQTLVEHGATVEIVSPSLCPGLKELVKDGAVRAVLKDYGPGDLDDALLVVAATDDAGINEKVAA